MQTMAIDLLKNKNKEEELTDVVSYSSATISLPQVTKICIS